MKIKLLRIEVLLFQCFELPGPCTDFFAVKTLRFSCLSIKLLSDHETITTQIACKNDTNWLCLSIKLNKTWTVKSAYSTSPFKFARSIPTKKLVLRMIKFVFHKQCQFHSVSFFERHILSFSRPAFCENLTCRNLEGVAVWLILQYRE